MFMVKKLRFLGLLIAVMAGIAVFAAPKAEAATLNVDGSCTLNEAVSQIGAGADGSGCVATGTYGSSDTINLPAGTTSLSQSVSSFSITTPVLVKGTGRGQTTINANSHEVFSVNTGGTLTVQDMTITGAAPYAVFADNAVSVTLQNVEITNSSSAVKIMAKQILVENCLVHENEETTNPTSFVGMHLIGKAQSGTDALSTIVRDTKVENNNGGSSGLRVEANSAAAQSLAVTVERTAVLSNQATSTAGLQIEYGQNSAPLAMSLSAVTVAKNQVSVAVASTEPQIASPAYVSGVVFTISNLTDRIHLANVTTAFNTATNNVDGHITAAGFFGLLFDAPRSISFANVSVVGNAVTQATPTPVGSLPAIFLANVKFAAPPDNSPQSIESGGQTQNMLITGNTFNGTSSSCRDDLDATSLAGLPGPFNMTPANGGHNMADDANCTNFSYYANLYSTVDHDVKDNGGPVPTVKLLPGSPAINGGGQVLGISTDARGIARQGYYSVGAYQGELLAASTTDTNAKGGTLAVTGVIAIPTVILLGILIATFTYTYLDYRKHLKPLLQIDPTIKHSYTYANHIKTVTLPLMRYRVTFSFSRNQSGPITKF